MMVNAAILSGKIKRRNLGQEDYDIWGRTRLYAIFVRRIVGKTSNLHIHGNP
jgi:hypothetical protein